MLLQSPGSVATSPPLPDRAIRAATHVLKRAVAEARSSLTVQEGLYRAYRDHLLGLEGMESLPVCLADPIRALLVDLSRGLGLEEATRRKVARSTLGSQDANLLLARLETMAASAETLGAALSRPTS